MANSKLTLDELLALANHVARHHDSTTLAGRLARAVIDMLGESQPCGWPEPVVDRGLRDENGHAGITWDASPIGETMLPDEARAIAVMLLRAADEAEGAG